MDKLTVVGRSDNNFVFFGKLVLVYLYMSRVIGTLGHIDLPLLPIYAAVPYSKWAFLLWQSLFAISTAFVFLNRKSEWFLFICGALVILGLLMNELSYSNNLVFAACLMITFSVSDSSRNLVPVQLSLVYFGAFIDKLCFEQWRNGDFMTSFFQHNHRLSPLQNFPWLMTSMTCSTLVIELLLAILFVIPKARIYAMLLGLVFHFSTVILMNDFFGFFIIGILIAYASLLKTSVNLNRELAFPRLIGALKSSPRRENADDEVRYRFEMNGTTYCGREALLLMIAWNPYTAILLTALFSCAGLWLKQAAFLLITLAACALAGKYNFLRVSNT